MKNIEMKKEGNKLTLEIDLTQDFGLSQRGKSHIVASTNGFVPVEGTNVSISLNAIKQ